MLPRTPQNRMRILNLPSVARKDLASYIAVSNFKVWKLTALEFLRLDEREPLSRAGGGFSPLSG
jgi:hypothetical protein